MRDNNDSYDHGNQSWKPSSDFRPGSAAYTGARDREWWDERHKNAVAEQQRKLLEPSTGRVVGTGKTAIAGEGLYKLLMLVVAGFVGWFGLKTGTAIGLSNNGQIVTGVIGLVGGIFSVRAFKSPLIATLGVVETIGKIGISVTIALFILYLFIN